MKNDNFSSSNGSSRINFHNQCSSNFILKVYSLVRGGELKSFLDLEKGQKNFRLPSIFRLQSLLFMTFLCSTLMKFALYEKNELKIENLLNSKTNFHHFFSPHKRLKKATYLIRDKKAELIGTRAAAAAAGIPFVSSQAPSQSHHQQISTRSWCFHTSFSMHIVLKSRLLSALINFKLKILFNCGDDLSRWPRNYFQISFEVLSRLGSKLLFNRRSSLTSLTLSLEIKLWSPRSCCP